MIKEIVLFISTSNYEQSFIWSASPTGVREGGRVRMSVSRRLAVENYVLTGGFLLGLVKGYLEHFAMHLALGVYSSVHHRLINEVYAMSKLRGLEHAGDVGHRMVRQIGEL